MSSVSYSCSTSSFTATSYLSSDFRVVGVSGMSGGVYHPSIGLVKTALWYPHPLTWAGWLPIISNMMVPSSPVGRGHRLYDLPGNSFPLCKLMEGPRYTPTFKIPREVSLQGNTTYLRCQRLVRGLPVGCKFANLVESGHCARSGDGVNRVTLFNFLS